MSTIPNTIFKYEGFNVRSLQNLKAPSVYFASPRQFNDPYDCAITVGVTEQTAEDLEVMKNHYLANPQMTASQRSELASLSQADLRAMLIRALSGAVQRAKERFAFECGISCFSERNDDLLMWSHYGGRYRGFCLEFRTEFEPFSKLRKVTYVDRMPNLRLSSLATGDDGEQLFDLYCTKSSDWAYEREWRGLHKKAGTLFCYEAPALKAVYFGPDIEREAMEIVCLVLGGQNPHVEFWQGKRSASEFKVEFERFPYIPYVVAKQMGLRD